MTRPRAVPVTAPEFWQGVVSALIAFVGAVLVMVLGSVVVRAAWYCG